MRCENQHGTAHFLSQPGFCVISVIPAAPVASAAWGAAMTCQVLSRTEKKGKTPRIWQRSLSAVSRKPGSAQHLWMEAEGFQHSPSAAFLWS